MRAARHSGGVTLIDDLLATAVLLGLVLSADIGSWLADSAAGRALVYYALREISRDVASWSSRLG